MIDTDGPGGPRGTQTLTRGLDMIRLVAEGVTEAGAIARAMDLPRSTAQRLLASLTAAGFLHNLPRQGYRLGPELIRLCACARAQRPLEALARPVLERLAAETGDTVHLGVPEGSEVLYLDKIDGTRGLEMRSRPGQRMPMALTGIGKAMLATLPETRWPGAYAAAAERQAAHPGRVAPRPWPAVEADLRAIARHGISFDREENEIGICCVAAAIRDASGQMVAALSLASAVPYLPEARLEGLAPQVAAAAAEISARLGHRTERSAGGGPQT